LVKACSPWNCSLPAFDFELQPAAQEQLREQDVFYPQILERSANQIALFSQKPIRKYLSSP
jgi:hypothetical protein